MEPETRLLHYSKKPLDLADIYSREQEEDVSTYGKPRGLWVSVEGENDWISWCRSESFGISPLAHKITLDPKANIRVIKGAYGLDEFTSEFHKKNPLVSYRDGIDWRRVAETYAGIIIAPYCWSRRMSLDWYYGWDCASGCIWDRAAIADIQRVPELDPMLSEA